MADVDWSPTPDDVGAEIRSRTTDDTGQELGTFTDETRPTVDDVYALIDAVTARIERRVGDVPESLQPDARRVAALGVACRVELTFFPEQVATGRSPYNHMKAAYDEDLAELVTACHDYAGDPTTGDVGLLAGDGFGPCDLVGMKTLW